MPMAHKCLWGRVGLSKGPDSFENHKEPRWYSKEVCAKCGATRERKMPPLWQPGPKDRVKFKL